MNFGLPPHHRQMSSSSSVAAGVGGVGADGNFWNGIVDKDALPSSNATSDNNSKIEPIKRKVIAFGVHIWNYIRPDVAGSGSISFRDLRKFRMYLLYVGCAATFFWIWAIYNTLHMKEGQDLGIYSFATVIITSLLGLFKAKPNGSFDKKLCVAMTVSHVLVTINYLLGVVFAFTVGTVIYWRFGIYCFSFSILWGYIAYQCWKLGVIAVELVDSSMEVIDEEERMIF